MLEKSCGTIPYTVREGKVFYLLIKDRYNGVCSFPKGHVEAGESEIETALRETLEETSLQPVIQAEARYELTYWLDNGNQKTAVYFLGDFQSQVPARYKNFEDYMYLILPYEEAYQTLSAENAKSMLQEANAYLCGTRT